MSLAPLDRGVRLISHKPVMSMVYDTDPELAFTVTVFLANPTFMAMAALALGGGEVIVAQAETLEWAEDFVRRNDLEENPRWRSTVITERDRVVVERPATAEHRARLKRQP